MNFIKLSFLMMFICCFVTIAQDAKGSKTEKGVEKTKDAKEEKSTKNKKGSDKKKNKTKTTKKNKNSRRVVEAKIKELTKKAVKAYIAAGDNLELKKKIKDDLRKAITKLDNEQLNYTKNYITQLENKTLPELKKKFDTLKKNQKKRINNKIRAFDSQVKKAS